MMGSDDDDPRYDDGGRIGPKAAEDEEIKTGGGRGLSIKAVIPTTLHVATGAATLATSLVLTLRAMRRFRLADAPEASPVMAREVIA